MDPTRSLEHRNSDSPQSLGTNLASRLSQARYVKLENSYFTKNGTRVFVDRKFDTTSMSNAALKYKPLDQLFRLALAAKSNPGMRFAIEVSKDGKNALPAFTKLLDDIRFNRISGEIRTGSGVLRYTADDTKFVLDMIRTHLLKLDADGKQVLQLLVENTISRTSPFPQNVIAEGTGLSPETLDLAHVYLQLAQARQYWLDQGASAARLNQASFAIANLPSGWAARTSPSRSRTAYSNGCVSKPPSAAAACRAWWARCWPRRCARKTPTRRPCAARCASNPGAPATAPTCG